MSASKTTSFESPTLETTVGQWVAQRSGRSRVFEKLGIDYCCGGDVTLREACQVKGLDPQKVFAELTADDQAAVPVNDDPAKLPLASLCDHIEKTHHAYLKTELPRLEAMVRKVAAVHGPRHPWVLEIDGVYAGLAAEFTSHMMKEEQVLFPSIRRLAQGEEQAMPGGWSVAGPIGVMEHEHDDTGRALERIRDLSSGYTLPPDGCNTFRVMLESLERLEMDTHTHIHLENNVLFPRALKQESALDIS